MRRRRSRAWRWATALVLLGGLAVSSCGNPSSAGGSIPGVVPSTVPATQPSDIAAMTGGAAKTAQQFLTDMQGGLCPAAFALVTDPLRTEAGTAAGLCGVVAPGSPFTVGSTTTLTTTSAFVGVSVVVSGVPQSETLTLLYQSSQWLVSNITGGSSVSPAPGEVSLANIVATIEQQYGTYNGGATATVSCPEAGTLAATPGQKFQCTYVDSRGRNGSLTITIQSSSGAFRWTIP
jgi:hypothetical protein